MSGRKSKGFTQHLVLSRPLRRANIRPRRIISKLSAGFTIVELLLATTIFSTIIVVSLSGFVQIGRLFYKGQTVTSNQQVARQIIDSVTNDIRFASTIDSNVHYFAGNSSLGYTCVGPVRYTFYLHNRVDTSAEDTTNADNHQFGLLRDKLAGFSGCGSPFSGDISPKVNLSGAVELLGNNMRLNNFQVFSAPGFLGQVYSVNLSLVTGNDSALQIDPLTDAASCNASLSISQFCDVINLSTSVTLVTGTLSNVSARSNGIVLAKSGAGNGTVVSINDPPGVQAMNCGSTCLTVYRDPVTITLQATTDPGSSSVFSKWIFNDASQHCTNGDMTANPCKIDVNGTVFLTAVFGCQTGSCNYQLTVGKSGNGTGTVTSNDGKINCGSNCSQIYSAPTDVTLTATAGPGSVFSGWSGSCIGGSSSSNPCKVNVSSQMTWTANFTLGVGP